MIFNFFLLLNLLFGFIQVIFFIINIIIYQAIKSSSNLIKEMLFKGLMCYLLQFLNFLLLLIGVLIYFILVKRSIKNI